MLSCPIFSTGVVANLILFLTILTFLSYHFLWVSHALIKVICSISSQFDDFVFSSNPRVVLTGQSQFTSVPLQDSLYQNIPVSALFSLCLFTNYSTLKKETILLLKRIV